LPPRPFGMGRAARGWFRTRAAERTPFPPRELTLTEIDPLDLRALSSPFTNEIRNVGTLRSPWLAVSHWTEGRTTDALLTRGLRKRSYGTKASSLLSLVLRCDGEAHAHTLAGPRRPLAGTPQARRFRLATKPPLAGNLRAVSEELSLSPSPAVPPRCYPSHVLCSHRPL
jgi:hypothetical protein